MAAPDPSLPEGPSVGVPTDDVVPFHRPAVFDFGGAVSSASTLTRGDLFDPYERASVVAARTNALVLTGTQENQKLVYDKLTETLALRPLQIRAPYDGLVPTIRLQVDGELFGTYRAAYRYKNSETGEVSGLSPITTESVTVGHQVAQTVDYYGQRLIYGAPGVDQTLEGVDTIEWFRTLDEGSLYFKVGESPNPGTSSSAEFEDNVSDVDLGISGEIEGLNPGPRYHAGLLPPVARAYQHPGGWTYYYGTKRMGPYRTGTVTVTEDSDEITFAGGAPTILSSREGQLLRLLETSGAATIDDAPGMRIVHINSSTTARVSSPVPLLEEMTAGSLSGATFEIVDDRDSRLVYPSENGKPLQIDMTRAFTIGESEDEELFFIFSLGGVTHAATRRRLYRIDNDGTESPELTQRTFVVAEEGTAGFYTSAVTPFGLVFLNEKGVRVFDGSRVTALGAENSFGAFLPRWQFAKFERSLLGQDAVIYDPVEHLVHVLYIPQGCAGLERELVFDPETGVWRGPWRRRFFNAGRLRADSGQDQFVFGDDSGNLLYDLVQRRDFVREVVGETMPIKTSIATVVTPNEIAVDDSLDLASDRMHGAPLLFRKRDGTYELNWALEVQGTTVVLFMVPRHTLFVGELILVGWIDWQLTTAEVDAGTIVFPEELDAIWLRHDKPEAVDDVDFQHEPFEALISVDSGVFVPVTSSVQHPSLREKTWEDFRVDKTGSTFSARLRGQTMQGAPTITQAALEFTVRGGRGERS